MRHEVPQPSPERIERAQGQPIVVGIVPGQPELVPLTAASFAEAVGGALYFGYADETRIVDEEYGDGTVRHSPLDPDVDDETWLRRARSIETFLHDLLDGRVQWEFRYLAGRADRALTHLARAVDASMIVVGTRQQSPTDRWHEFFAESVGLRLTRHQHRPVLVVPLTVVDWKAPAPWK